jgi:uncharacterized protein (UPF0548 family)
MLALSPPSREAILHFLEQQRDQPFTYPQAGATRGGEAPPGFVADHREREIGRGREAFEAAGAAMRRWEMFHLGWVEICWPETPIVPGAVVASVIRFGGVRWVNACRIVYVLDEARRFGLAYGTLPGHVESGEELFAIEWRDDDSVWYSISAFSRPRFWLVRLAYPIARRLQRRFAVDSLAAMARAVGSVTVP